MSSECKMKKIKLPPPIPPRPSKILIEEALAKTRKKSEVSGVSAREDQARQITGQSYEQSCMSKNQIYVNTSNTRPIIYQSGNFKNQINEDAVENSREAGEKGENKLEKITVNRSDSIRSQGSDLSNTRVSVNKPPSPTYKWVGEISDNRNVVNSLIDEMFASVLEVTSSVSTSLTSLNSNNEGSLAAEGNSRKSSVDNDNLTIIVINEQSEPVSSLATPKDKPDDLYNHEFLINELQDMKNHKDNILKRQRASPDLKREDSQSSGTILLEVDKGKKVRMDTTANEKSECLSRVYNLPPLPQSLSGFMDFARENDSNIRSDQKNQYEVCVKGKTTLDQQLSILRREMNILREQDLFLLSKLWFLNESIQDFRQILQEEKKNTFPSPPVSCADDDEFYVTSTC